MYLSILLFVIVAQCIYIIFLERGGFSILSRGAIFFRLMVLELLRVPCALVILDIRKMHTLNAVLGYNLSDSTVARIIRHKKDIAGTLGGDEIAVVVPFAKMGTARAIAARIIKKSRAITQKLPGETRGKIAQRTNGIVDGVYVATVVIERTRRPYSMSRECLDILEDMKEDGCKITGDRDTTGNRGTLVKVLS